MKISIFVFVCACSCFFSVSAQSSRPEGTPSFRELWEFCEKNLRAIEEPGETPAEKESGPKNVPALLARMQREERLRIWRVYEKKRAEEKWTSRGRNAHLPHKAIEQIKFLNRLGMFKNSLDCAMELLAQKNPYTKTGLIHVYIAQNYKWMGNTSEAEKFFKRGKELFRKSNDPNEEKDKRNMAWMKEKREQIKKEFGELEERFRQHDQLFPALEDARKKISKMPQDPEPWHKFAQMADRLGYRVEQLAFAQAFISLLKTGEISAGDPRQQAEMEETSLRFLAYGCLVTEQFERAIELGALFKKGSPEPYFLRIRAYLGLKEKIKARQELQALQSKFPDVAEKRKEELKNLEKRIDE